MRKSLLERFEKKYRINGETGCWEWTASTNGVGYGMLYKGDGAPAGARLLAHRVSWLLFKGPIPEHESYHGICVLHKCDNPSCVNPDHLFLGTNEENISDCQRKDRKGRKLNAEKAREIRARLSGGDAIRQLAREYGVNRTTIKKIKTKRYWAHVEA